MADNVLITPGSGDTVGADDIGSVKYQRVKMIIGADGVNDGDISSANPLPVTGTLSGVTGSVNVHIGSTGGTINVFSVAQGTVAIAAKDGTMAVYFSPAQPTVSVLQGGVAIGNSGVVGATTQRVVHATDVVQSMNIMAIGTTNTLGVYLSATAGTIGVDVGKMQQADFVTRVRNLVDGTLTTVTGVDRVRNVVDGTLTTVTNVTTLATATRVDRVMNLVDGTVSTVTFVPVVQRVQNVVDGTLSLVTMTQRVNNVVDGSIKIFLQGGQAIGNSGVVGATTTRVVHATDVVQSMNIMAIGTTNTLGVYLSATAGTINVFNITQGTVAVSAKDGTMAVYFSPARPVVLADNLNTANIFTVSGSTSGGTTSGVTLISPSANASFKVFAFSLQTTGIVASVWRFCNGSGASQTEFFRGLVTANQTSSTPIGANLAVQPPGFLFATGTSTTLALVSDTGSLVHYSVSYIKESA